MISLNVEVETEGVLKLLVGLSRDQIPYATSQALNSTIFDVRKQIVGETWARAFKVRNARYPSAAFRVTKASKRELHATLYDKLQRTSLPLHAEGGIKRPRGRSLAIPTEKIKRTGSGKIPAGKKPRTLPNSFVGNPFGKGRGIWQKDKRTGRMQLMYDLEVLARIRKRFNFYQDAERVVDRVYSKHWERSFNRALATAR